MTQAVWCWVLWPVIGAWYTIPHLGEVLAKSPKLPMLYCLLMGLAYGVGGTAFNLAIRYIGFGLSYAITIGLSAVLGTLTAPMVQGKLGATLQKPGAGWLMAGIAVGTARPSCPTFCAGSGGTIPRPSKPRRKRANLSPPCSLPAKAGRNFGPIRVWAVS